MEQVVLAEEVHRAEAPAALNPIGLANIAPSIMTWGTSEVWLEELATLVIDQDAPPITIED